MAMTTYTTTFYLSPRKNCKIWKNMVQTKCPTLDKRLNNHTRKRARQGFWYKIRRRRGAIKR